MGLDILAIERAEFVHGPDQRTDDCYEDENHIVIYTLPDFAGRLDGWKPGCYQASGDSFHFHAGSYGGYNHWREQLSQRVLGVEPGAIWANPGAWVGRPFVELIHFADNEGAIGPDTCAKLAADFEQASPLAQSWWGEDDFGYSLAKFHDWATAFALAQRHGFVVFR